MSLGHTFNYIFWKNFSRIEKVMITFSIFEKIFPKIKNLIYVLKTHINQTFLLGHTLTGRFYFYYQIQTNFCSYFHVDSHLCRLSYAKENTRKLSKKKKKKPPGRGRQGPLSQLHSQYFPIYQNGLPWAVKKKGW